MMLYPAMSKLTHYIPNRYMLVNVVALRARQIAESANRAGEPLLEKPVTLAVNEVAEGKLSVYPHEEAPADAATPSADVSETAEEAGGI